MKNLSFSIISPHFGNRNLSSSPGLRQVIDSVLGLVLRLVHFPLPHVENLYLTLPGFGCPSIVTCLDTDHSLPVQTNGCLEELVWGAVSGACLSGASIHSGWLACQNWHGEGDIFGPARQGPHSRSLKHSTAAGSGPGRANAGEKSDHLSRHLRGVFAHMGLPMEKPHRAEQTLCHRAAVNTPVLMFHQSPKATGGCPDSTALLGKPWTGTVRAGQPPDIHK